MSLTDIFSFSDLYLCAMDGKHSTWASMRVELDEEIDRGTMETILQKTRQRMPYMFQTIKEEKGCMLFVPNDSEIRLHEDPLDYIIDFGHNDGFLVRFSANGPYFTASMLHAISDGSGTANLVKLLLTEYFKAKGEDIVEAKNIMKLDDEPSSRETLEPFSLLPDGIKGNKGKPLPFHVLKGNASGLIYTYNFRISQKKLMGFASSYDGSPNAITSIVLAKAIKEVDGDNVTGDINIDTVINCKNILGCPESHIPCVFGSTFHFNDRTFKMDTELLHTCVRGRLIVDTEKDAVSAGLAGLKEFGNLLNNIKGMDGKRLICNHIITKPMSTAVVSYPAERDWGSIENHIKSYKAFAEGAAPITVIIYANGYFHFTITAQMDFTPYAEKVCEIFNEMGMECSPLEKEILHEAPARIKKPKLGLNAPTFHLIAGLLRQHRHQSV